MFCYASVSTDVYRSLATEEYLLKQSREDFFMLWRSDNAIVVGKNQDVEAEVDLAVAGERNIRIARRFSGGGTVYQDLGNFNLTFIETTTDICFSRYVDRVISFLSSVGIQAQADERLGITAQGAKISGSAQCVHKNRILFHCTLLYSTDLDMLNASINGKPSAGVLPGTRSLRAVPSVRSRVTNLNREMVCPPALEQFGGLILDYFLKEEKDNRRLDSLSFADEVAIEALRDCKYARPAWIFDRISVK